jgi:hypothetical protein
MRSQLLKSGTETSSILSNSTTNCKRKNENYSKIRASGSVPILAPKPELIGPAGPLLDGLEALQRRHSIAEQNPAAQTISDQVDQARGGMENSTKITGKRGRRKTIYVRNFVSSSTDILNRRRILGRSRRSRSI